MVMYSVFGDESHDDLSQRVFSVSGVFGTQNEWDRLRVKWVQRTGGRIFHAASCESDPPAGEYAGTDHKENLKLYADLTQLLVRSNLMGLASSMSLEEFWKVFPWVGDDREQPYYMCFSEVLLDIPELGHLSIPQGKIKFTFDQNLDTQFNAGALYDYMLHLPEWRFQPYLADEISFSSRENPCIQAADLVAREGMKHLDNRIGPKKKIIRRSYEVLRNTGRFHFHEMRQRDFEKLSEAADQMRDTPGAKMTEYLAWVKENGYMDNFSNKIRYLHHIDCLVAQEKARSL